jgi:hypothetical protein
MTLQEAKDQVANKYGYKDWKSIDFYELDSNLSSVVDFDSRHLVDEAAELYAFEKAKFYAEVKVSEQRELMSKHLNMRNVPKPKI